MGYEYTSAGGLEPALWDALAVKLPNERYTLVSKAVHDRISLRFADRPAKTEWPEDAEVYLGDTVSVVFHSGSEDERHEFLRHLEGCLRELGCPLRFEEA